MIMGATRRLLHSVVGLFGLVVAAAVHMGSCHGTRFSVGNKDGWVLDPSEGFNHWAERNRFLVNDILNFKYEKGEDSVLTVRKDDFYSCNTDSPIMKLDSGDDDFKLDRSGPFFFISGVKSHCVKGQKLVVVVLSDKHRLPSPLTHPPVAAAPTPKTAPATAPTQQPSPSSPPSSSPMTHPSTAPAPPKSVGSSSAPALHPSPSSPTPSPKPATVPTAPIQAAASPRTKPVPATSPSGGAPAPSTPKSGNVPAASPATVTAGPTSSTPPSSSASSPAPGSAISASPSEDPAADRAPVPVPVPSPSAVGLGLSGSMMVALPVTFALMALLSGI